jgi:hypothetical protein
MPARAIPSFTCAQNMRCFEKLIFTLLDLHDWILLELFPLLLRPPIPGIAPSQVAMVLVFPISVRYGSSSHLFWESATYFASDTTIRTLLSSCLLLWALREADPYRGLSANASSIGADRELFLHHKNQELAPAVFWGPWFGGHTTDSATTQDRLQGEPCCETLPDSFDNEEWLCMRQNRVRI